MYVGRGSKSGHAVLFFAFLKKAAFLVFSEKSSFFQKCKNKTACKKFKKNTFFLKKAAFLGRRGHTSEKDHKMTVTYVRSSWRTSTEILVHTNVQQTLLARAPNGRVLPYLGLAYIKVLQKF